MNSETKTSFTLAVVCAAFSALALAFWSDPGGSHLQRKAIPLVDTNFLDKSTTRKSYADLVKAGADLSDFDCYACHDKKSPPPLRLDTNQAIIVAAEHAGPTNFASDDFAANELPVLIARVKTHADPVPELVWQRVSAADQQLLLKSDATSTPARDIVLTALNKVVGEPCIYDAARFKGIVLDSETVVHLQQSRTGPKLPHLNRLLLEEAFGLQRNRHADIVMGHGQHGRNNNCYNCHNETNLTLLQPRDGRQLTFTESSQLCGSCHGPTKADWDAGAHGRTSGYWDTSQGPIERKDCVNCHNPHHPHFPPRRPAPGPHPLREVTVATAESTRQE